MMGRVVLLETALALLGACASLSGQAEMGHEKFTLVPGDLAAGGGASVRLAQTPVPGSVRVTLRGKPLAGFTVTGNRISIPPAQRPARGETVEVAYRPFAFTGACAQFAASRAPRVDWSTTTPEVRNCVSYWNGKWHDCCTEGTSEPAGERPAGR